MRKYARLRSLAKSLQQTPFHPQWFVLSNSEQNLAQLATWVNGQTLDIGAGEQEIRDLLPASITYYSLDYYQTATEWYGTIPMIFGDAHTLPFADEQFDTVLLLDVLEHLRVPPQALKEIHRVMPAGGQFILQVPFLYPLHDTPYDFRRWTTFGFQILADQHGFEIKEMIPLGHPIQTSALLKNIAYSKTMLSWVEKKSPLAILTLFLPLIILLTNLNGWLWTKIASDETMMPHGYRMKWEKI